ncbi:hypothetical protein [Maribacter sp. R77961]|uniref:hypothetical protein n=1 Tax=Maribacter sp. R77961 TaxID=3093871 RepID=UPI0037C6321A
MDNKIFAVDEVPFNQREKLKEKVNPYLLKNYFFLGAKLDKKLYYNYFVRTILFDIDIMELDDLITFQFENSQNPKVLLELIDFKVLPDIDKIISNACFGNASTYRDEKKLNYGFIESNDVIKCFKFDFNCFYHLTMISNLQQDLQKRKEILSNTINQLNNKNETNKLTWVGKPAHLAMIIRELADLGYIKMPYKASGDPFPTETARQIQNSFTIARGCKMESIIRYANSDDEKHQKLKQNFTDKGFDIPNSKQME